MTSKTLSISDLAHFTGTEQIWRHGLVRHIVYTDGVQHVAEAGEAYWLVDKIDYVITHELCHRVHHHHGPKFFELLDRVMPDWPERKQSLERRLA